MAPLPDNGTIRWQIDYSQGSTTHTMLVRGVSGATYLEMDAAMADFLGAVGGMFLESHITAVRQAASGSDLFFPIGSSLVGDNFGTGTSTAATQARQVTFVGRSSGGRRARLSIFGYVVAPVDYRLTPTEDGAVGNGVDELNAHPTIFAAIDGIKATWNDYANVALNDYWVRKAR